MCCGSLFPGTFFFIQQIKTHNSFKNNNWAYEFVSITKIIFYCYTKVSSRRLLISFCEFSVSEVTWISFSFSKTFHLLAKSFFKPQNHITLYVSGGELSFAENHLFLSGLLGLKWTGIVFKRLPLLLSWILPVSCATYQNQQFHRNCSWKNEWKPRSTPWFPWCWSL